MYKHKRLIAFFLILSLCSLSLVSAVQPQTVGETGKLEISLADLGYKTDETLTGIRVDREYGVNWSKDWKPEPGSKLTLSFSHSEAIKTSSSVVVDWNGTRLGSTLLNPDNAHRGSLEVQIPENLIQPGYNALRLEFYMGIHDDFCEDIYNPAVWATIHSDSMLSLVYLNLPPELDLGQFPYPLVDNSDLVINKVTFVVPDQPSEAVLNAVAIISAKLGKAASYRTLNLETLSSQSAANVTGDMVYVSLADQLKALGTPDLPFLSGQADLVDQQNTPLPEGAGLLWEQLSPSDPTSVTLIVTAKTDAGLLKAAAALGNDAAIARLTGQMGTVLEISRPEIGKSPVDRVITLRELGYADIAARGFRDQTVNFNIPLPLAWQINASIPLDLHFAHSNLLDEKMSAMNILLNGSPVSNIILNNANAEDAWATVELPARLFKIGDNKLTIQSTITLLSGYIDATLCGKNYEDEAWVSVYSDSQLHLPSAPSGIQIMLQDYPYAYTGDPSLVQLALVVPDQADVAIANAVTQIAGRLGRYASGPALYPVVQSASTAEKDPYPYQILIGIAAGHSAIQKINDGLPLPFEPGTSQLKPNAKLPAIVSPQTGYLQVIQTADGRPILIVSGTDPQSLLWAAGALSVPKMMVNLKGDAAVLDGENSISTFQIREPQLPEPTLPPPGPNQAPQPVPWVLWIAYAFIALAVLIFLVLGIIVWIRHNREKKAYETR